ncbi:uncharacterized protein LOC119173938 [Rhipicephalus microplus]|uniref:uncharacterized protein LOC119173938 n=1 Tax=Rhipicephalus microplus TaxID=6941 RepID=UPI003F6A79F1
MANRGPAYGLSAQVQNKIAGKRDPALEESIMQWMAAILGQPLPNGDFGDILRDGVVLCNLMNKLMPGCIPKINTSGGQFKLMENITHFQNAAKAWGVPEIDVFQTVDLWEKRNIPQVAQCLMAVGRACYMHPEYRGPCLGPKPAEEQKREWTQEQLRAGEGIINLQYGSNKGATQSGQNFGNTRHIVPPREAPGNFFRPSSALQDVMVSTSAVDDSKVRPARDDPEMFFDEHPRDGLDYGSVGMPREKHVDVLEQLASYNDRTISTELIRLAVFIDELQQPSVIPSMGASVLIAATKAVTTTTQMPTNTVSKGSTNVLRPFACREYALLQFVMAYRGPAYGLSAQIASKIASKRDAELESQILDWIEEVLEQRLPQGPYEEVLRDGVVLCKLMNALNPGCIPKINTTGGQFKKMENIVLFQNAAKEWGVPDLDVFQTVDLWERRNIPQVSQCILALGRACYLHPEYQGPCLGPKPAEENKRNFSEQQLRAGEGIINLQYGTNKGANASGINFGNTRHM